MGTISRATPAQGGAAGRPLEEKRLRPDPWLQARLLDAALEAASRTPGIEGAFAWLWEGVGNPPFRDSSFTIQGKPAELALVHWYAGLGR